METTLIRPTLVWTPSDTTDVTFIWENGKSEGDGAAWTSVSLQRAGLLPEFTPGFKASLSRCQTTQKQRTRSGFSRDRRADRPGKPQDWFSRAIAP